MRKSLTAETATAEALLQVICWNFIMFVSFTFQNGFTKVKSRKQRQEGLLKKSSHESCMDGFSVHEVIYRLFTTFQ